VEAYKALGLSKLDGVICNAGIMALASRTTTVDGFEAQFGTNHLGHFLLVNLLFPELLKASKPRVVSLRVHELFKTPQQGASTSVWAAVALELEGRGGNYLEDCKISQTVTPKAGIPSG
jgi:NAD(P)-dependent dehydrogenase (short-subunit alcohol dehydrogenase family)